MGQGQRPDLKSQMAKDMANKLTLELIPENKNEGIFILNYLPIEKRQLIPVVLNNMIMPNKQILYLTSYATCIKSYREK